jgi:hypothetical protein
MRACLIIGGRMAVTQGGDQTVQALGTGAANGLAGVTGGYPQYREALPQRALQRLTNAPAVTASSAS